MADCKQCGRDIEDSRTVTCSKNPVSYNDDTFLPRVPHGNDEIERCPVCFVAPGGFHHEGCYIEKCPRCGKRLVSCGCLIKNRVM